MSDDTKPSRRNSQPAHPSPMDDETWKTNPSGETTGDEGTNAELEKKRKVDENAPRGRETRRGHAVTDKPE